MTEEATEYVTKKNDIEKWESRNVVEVPAAPQNQQASFFEAIERLAANPAVDVEKMKQIMEMQEHVLDRNAEQAFNAAMVRAQAKMPTVPKDRENTQTHSRYSSYEIVLKYTKPIYTGEGFSVLMYEGDAKREDEIRVYADIMHEQGHTKKRYVDIPIDDKGIKGTVNKTKPHAKGSSLSYGKGYLIKMIFNIPTGDDDDGNAAGTTYVNNKQLSSIIDMINAKNIDDSLFLKHMGVVSADKIPANDFNRAMNVLKKAKGKK